MGRRVADGGGRPVVLTALGSGEKLFALLPLALLSAASVAGLAANGDADLAASAQPPVDAGTTVGPVGLQSAPGQASPSGTPTSARPSISHTAAPVVPGEDTSPEMVDQEREPVDEPTAASPQVEPPKAPTESPAEAEPPPAPTPSPTTPAETPDDGILTRAEATVRCLESGISGLDVVALAACVEDLLG
ncbi:MAG TPA: hypothetical protein VNP92_22270 [Actinophytocola sp.]|nr:hypothetical protein [Actinophytocola sp.]